MSSAVVRDSESGQLERSSSSSQVQDEDWVGAQRPGLPDSAHAGNPLRPGRLPPAGQAPVRTRRPGRQQLLHLKRNCGYYDMGGPKRLSSGWRSFSFSPLHGRTPDPCSPAGRGGWRWRRRRIGLDIVWSRKKRLAFRVDVKRFPGSHGAAVRNSCWVCWVLVRHRAACCQGSCVKTPTRTSAALIFSCRASPPRHRWDTSAPGENLRAKRKSVPRARSSRAQ